jgi:S-adenosylmethionine:tRNA ribosyltransferase-isomerase
MRVDLFDFDLPEAQIALRPARPRDSARLLIAPPRGEVEDAVMRDLPAALRPGDLLVFNDTRVIPARLTGVRTRGDSEVRVEATLHQRQSPSSWSAFMRPGKRLAPGDRIRFGQIRDGACLIGALDASVAAKGEGGEITLAFDLAGPALDEAIADRGIMPLPPYIAAKRPEDEADRSDYQTIYARADGAVAAPTAGLHFTPALFAALAARGVESAFVTLHVGAGTFLPIKAEETEAHRMHAEWRTISEDAAAAINRARRDRRRVVAIGTTALRTLESAADETGYVRAQSGDTAIFITPGYRFRVVDGLLTNFHLPRSTLFMLVAAFAGLERMRAVYAHAIAAGYRFYSYGDASLLWRAEAA